MVRGPSPLASGSSTPYLGAVPEDATHTDVWKLPPSLQTNRSHSDREMKGKAKAVPRAARASQSHSMTTPASMQIGEWTVDTNAVKEGADKWRTKERVILVLGSPSADSLSPLLYDDTYSDTLLLVGTPTPVPSLEALLSPPDSSAFTFQPAFRLFSPPTPVADGASPIPALLEEAQSIARAYRLGGRRSRRMSSGGISLSGLMPDSPSMGLRGMSFFDTGSSSSLPRTPSDVSIPSIPSRYRFSTMSFSKSSSDDEGRRLNLTATSGSPFDAVINFLQPSSSPQNSIREMLHQTMVLTTGIWPVVMLRSQGPVAGDLPIPLLHILPSKVIGPIPNIIEDYLVSFKVGVRAGPREIRGMVVHSSVWKTPQVELYDGLIRPVQSGANLLLLNGTRSDCGRALISRWKACVDVLGTATTESSPSSTLKPHDRLSVTVRRSSLLVPTSPRPLSPEPVRSNLGSPGYTNLQLEAAPGTPELAPTSMSSCSSTTGSGAEPTEFTTAGSTEGENTPRVVNADHEKGISPDSGGTIAKKFGKAWKRVLNLRGRDRS